MNKLLIKKPLITEKATLLGTFNQYLFLVAKEATKPEVKKAIEGIYKVKVEKVTVINTKSKTRRLGRSVGTKPGYKKMIVSLKEGQKLDILPQ
jgi:large subunit ribosomal protein L23